MKLSAQVRSTHSQDGAIVLDILHGQMFSANVVGSRILELLKRERTEAQMIERAKPRILRPPRSSSCGPPGISRASRETSFTRNAFR